MAYFVEINEAPSPYSMLKHIGNTDACAKKLSQILANNIDNGGRGSGLRLYEVLWLHACIACCYFIYTANSWSNILIHFSAVLNVHSLSNKSKIKQTFNFLDLLKLCYFISASNSPAILVLLIFGTKTSDSSSEEPEKSLKSSYSAIFFFFFTSKGE